MIILDTNVISELMRPAPSAAVLEWVDKQAVLTLYVTAITLGEIRSGIAILPDERRKIDLAQNFEDGIRPLFGDRVLSFDEPASQAYSRLRATARAQGLAIGNVDGLIAGIARTHGFVIATGDVSPFRAAGLQVINPFDDM